MSAHIKQSRMDIGEISTDVFGPDHIGKDVSVTYSPTSQVITRPTGFMDAYDYTLNPYSGCSFGCSYCYAAFFSRDIEKRDNWGYWVNVKQNAVEKMQNLRRSLDGKLIYMSSVTDAYQPIERELELTRRLLQIMAERHKPKLVVQTRSPLVKRDCDLFQKIERNGGRVQVNVTITTDDEDIRRIFEPSCPSNPARLKAIQRVQEYGIETCITMTPLLLVNSDRDFADDLIDTGVKKFIIQPFHFRQGKFLAGTRDKAYQLMTEKLDCTPDDMISKYMARYQKFFKILDRKLNQKNLPRLEEGKVGFAPPF